jgi:GH43 family beta-xylosidase
MQRVARRRSVVALLLLATLGACGTDAARADSHPSATSTTATTAPASSPAAALVACLQRQGVATDVDPSLPIAELRARLRRELASPNARGVAETCLLRIRAVSGDRSSSGDGKPRNPATSGTVPVFEGDFADPFVLQVGATFYAYATNTPLANVPFGAAQVGRRTRLDGDALPALPSWSEPGHVWAPAVASNGSGYRLYYTTRDRASGRQCISIASAASPAGPFHDASTGPLVCQRDLGGSIDPSPIDVNGRHYLMWKNDGNCCDIPSRIWIAPLTSDGRRLAGDPVPLLGADQPWEGGLVEGPSMIEDHGRFYLFYSANAWDTSSYAMGYAVCDTVTGPCHKAAGGPWLGTEGEIAGPGGGSAFRTSRGAAYLVDAAWSSDAVGYDKGGSRQLYVQPLAFTNGVPTLGSAAR